MTVDRVVYNSYERVTSSDMNREAALNNRALLEGLHGVISVTGQAFGSVGFRRSGILHGFWVEAVPGQMQVTVTAGLGLMKNVANVYPNSQWEWMELQDTVVVNVPAGGVQARYDVVEVRPRQVISSTQGRDIFNPNLGTFSQSNITKEYKSDPEFQVRSGVEGVTPSLPDGTTGWMPIAYLRIPGGAVSIGADDLMWCRPLLCPRQVDAQQPLQGGGIEVTAAGFSGSHKGARGQFPSGNLVWSIDPATTYKLDNMSYDGSGAFPVVDTVVYVYAIPPPFPTGYDSHLAPREVFTRSSTFAYNGGGFESGQQNCIVVSSANPPDLTQQGAPAIGGTSNLAAPFWGSGDNAVPRSNWVYLGAVFVDTAIPGMTVQRVVGPNVAPERKTGFDFLADLPIAGPTVKNLWSNITGDADQQLPVTARKCHVSGKFDLDPGGMLFLQIEDFWTGTSQLGRVCINTYNGWAAVRRNGDVYVVHTDASGNVTLQSGDAMFVNADMRIHVRAYEDAVLAQR